MALRRTQSTLDRSLPFVALERTATSVNKNLVLAEPDTILASSRLHPTKLRCTDLWSKSMKKEAARILWETQNPQILERVCTSKVIPKVKKNPEDLQDKRVRRLLSKQDSMYLKPVEKMDWGGSLQLCAQLQSEVRSFKQSISPERRRVRREEPINYVKQEVKRYLEDHKLPYIMRKISVASQAKRLDRLGVSFYKAQRKHKVDDL